MKSAKLTALAAGLSFSLLLGACAGAGQNAAGASQAPTEVTESAAESAAADESAAAAESEDASGAAAESAAEEEKDAESGAAKDGAEESEAEAAGSIYSEMDGIIFGFMSGVGAWETTLKVAPDGSFEGQFFDMNMGETGEGYDHGTLYECAFTGRFSEAVPDGDLAYTAKVEELKFETEKDGSNEYIDEEKMRHVMTEPYGLHLNDEIRICLPGTPYEDLSEGFLSWMVWRLQKGEDLPEMAIYNTTGEYVFYPDHYAMGDAEEFYAAQEARRKEQNAAGATGTDSAAGTGTEQTGDGSDAADTANAGPTELYLSALHAYRDQTMPDYYAMPYAPHYTYKPEAPYESVNEDALQGRWVNRYEEGGAKIEEILTVNGDRARIECYRDGVPTYAWNGEGTLSIEDRSDRGLCPAVRIYSDTGENVCTIYVRWVKGTSFYDGGFLNEWVREAPKDPSKQYLYETVTMENLQGLWYGEYEDGAGMYMTLLNIEGDKGWIFETVNNKISSVWNGEGKFSLKMSEASLETNYPMLGLKESDAADAKYIAGIYITRVEKDRFYDAGLNRWYVRIDPSYGADFENVSDPEFTYNNDGSLDMTLTYRYHIDPVGEVTQDGGCKNWKIHVSGDNGLDQTLDLQIDDDVDYLPEATYIVSEEDVDFDGQQDILLYRGAAGPQSVLHYNCFLVKDGRLTECRGFAEIPNAFADPSSRMILGYSQEDENTVVELHYAVQDAQVSLLEEVVYKYDEKLQQYVAQP